MSTRMLFVVAVLAAVLVTPALATELVRGPYVQMLGEEGFILRWRSDAAVSSRVRYGLSPDALTETVSSVDPQTEHEVTIVGLPAFSEVWYSVGFVGGDFDAGADTFSVRTAPPPNFAQPLRVWALGDSGLPGPDQRAVFDAYHDWSSYRIPDVWLLLGDNAYVTGTDAEYQLGFFDPYAALLPRCAVWPVRGNHDALHPDVDDDYFDFFTLPVAAELGGVASGTESWFSFDQGDVHFVVLDTYGALTSLPNPMFDWLIQDLASHDRLWTIVATHYGPYSKGSHDSDLDWHMTRVREDFVPLFDAGGVDLVLSGHSHGYERSVLLNGHVGLSTSLDPGEVLDDGDGRREGDGVYRKPTPGRAANEGVVYVVAGASSRVGTGSYDHPAMWQSEPTLGSFVFDVDGLRLDARYLDATGYTRDYFSLEKGAVVAVEPGLEERGIHLESNRLRIGSRIECVGPAQTALRLEVFDLRGRRLRSIPLVAADSERRAMTWDGRDDRGESLARGTYLLRLVAADRTLATARVAYLR